MNRSPLLLLLLLASPVAYSQVPTNVSVRILKAEDARTYDGELGSLLKSPNEQIRIRAALAAGRIGNNAAIPLLTAILENDVSEKARATAAFALGEIESIKAADAVLLALKGSRAVRAETRVLTSVPIGWRVGTLPNGRVSAMAAFLGESGPTGWRVGTLPNGRVSARREQTAAGGSASQLIARLVEAAGKIAAANAKDEKSNALGAAVLNALEAEFKKGSAPSVDVIRLGLTAVLRARPVGAEEIVRKFLSYSDPNIVADALNTLARLRAKNANHDARDLLATHVHAIVRANAARVLGAAEDKEAVDVLIKAATGDSDSRVRVSAIRSLANLKDARVAASIIEHAEKLLKELSNAKLRPSVEKNELLEIATLLGRSIPGSKDKAAIRFLHQFEFLPLDYGRSPEIYLSRLQIDPEYLDFFTENNDWRWLSVSSQMLGELAAIESDSDRVKELKARAPFHLMNMVVAYVTASPKESPDSVKAGPDILRALAKYKTFHVVLFLNDALKNNDVFVRSTAADLLAELPASKENVHALKTAFAKSLQFDKHDNDAQMYILSALVKLDKREAAASLKLALGAPDYLVRRRAAELIRQNDLAKDFPNFENEVGPVRKYDPKAGTKLGQILNTDADYKRAAARKNGTVNAVLTTEKGTFTIELLPEDAPLTVDNFIKLAKSNYFNGLEVHRVVPNFVMQDGDPRGDGNGGPGWSIRCEINMVPYERGAVGMALSGKDTGGSQWFVTHSPQPHLDGGYTVFGRVNSEGMKSVDNIVRGDKILSVRIIEGNLPQSTRRTPRKKK